MLALVMGGAACGKSEYAERLILQSPHTPRIYVAAMLSRGAEDAARVARHRAMRAKKSFVTVERPLNLAGWRCPRGAAVLVECITNLLANELYEPGGAGSQAVQAILTGLRSAQERAGLVVVVTGDVFADGRQYDAETTRYVAMLGEINRALAVQAGLVTEVVYGIPLTIKRQGGDLCRSN